MSTLYGFSYAKNPLVEKLKKGRMASLDNIVLHSPSINLTPSPLAGYTSS